jgi:hypothetical protein
MSQARVVVFKEVRTGKEGEWQLCLQWCRYEYNTEEEQQGYRFIWRRPNGKLQAARGQTRIPSVSDILELTARAIRDGWGHNICESDGYQIED